MPRARCSPVPESPICAPVTSGGPSSKPVVDAEPPAHCATFSYTLQSSYGPGPKPFTDARMIRGFIACTASQVKPMRSSAPGAKFSTMTSQVFTSPWRISLPLGLRASMVIERLLWFSMVKYRLSTLGISCNCPRVMSPTPGRSTLMTSAPNQASNCVQVGPDCTWVKSRMRTPSSALDILCSSLLGPRVLRQGALGVEIADVAALAARRRIDHRVDQRGLAGVHGRVDGAFQLVRRGRIDANAAEPLDHLVVTGALDEAGRCGVG